MTKINGIADQSYVTGKLKPVQSSGADFAQALNKVLENGQSQGPGPATEATQTASLGEVQAVVPFKTEASSAEVAGQTGDLLNLLDDYARQLQDPQKQLKDLAPMIDKIKSDAEKLMEKAQVTGDESLNEIATHTAMTANLAYIKFQRGDFL